MFSQTVQSKIKRIDFYRKLPKDLTEPTLSGAIVSLVALTIMAVLFLSEIARYLQVTTTSEMFVDINRGGEKLEINVDIEFPRFPCALISLDAQDVMGTHIVDVGGSMKKIRLSKDGAVISEADLLKGPKPTEADAKSQADAFEGCQIAGHLLVNKVPGNFHISSHAQQAWVNKFFGTKSDRLDLSHTVHHLSFGSTLQLDHIRQNFAEGVLNPLDGVAKLRADSVKNSINYEYYIKVVPTTYRRLDQTEYYVNQFTANTNEYKANGAPAVYFRYDLSPVTVRFSQYQDSFFHFLVQLCAIVGGVFTVAGLIDNFLHSSISSLLNRRQAGKLG